MKKLKLKLDGMKEMLTKEQMKKISGGYSGGGGGFWCYFEVDSACGGGRIPAWCDNDPSYCAEVLYENGCATNPCCDGVDCSGHS